MSRIHADRRAIETRPEPEAHGRVVRRLEAFLRSELRFAHDFARIELSSTWADWGCASVVEYGSRHGYRAGQVGTWATLGKALCAVPELEVRILDHRIPLEHAEIIAPLMLEAALLEERGEWLHLAERTSARRLRGYVSRRIEQIRQARDDLAAITVWAPRSVKGDWHRAVDVASTEAGRTLSEGEAFCHIISFFLEKKDPLRRAARLEARHGAALEASRNRAVPRGPPRHGDVMGRDAASRRTAPARECRRARSAGPPLAANLPLGAGPPPAANPPLGAGPPPAANLPPGAGPPDGTARRVDAGMPVESSVPIADPQVLELPPRRPRRPGGRKEGGRPGEGESDRSRYVPMAVQRQLWLRAGGVCEVPGCGCGRNLQICHIRGWARGGSNGRWNLLLLCRRHHLLLDAGKLRFLRWSKGGRPGFRTPDGKMLKPEARGPPQGGRAG